MEEQSPLDAEVGTQTKDLTSYYVNCPILCEQAIQYIPGSEEDSDFYKSRPRLRQTAGTGITLVP